MAMGYLVLWHISMARRQSDLERRVYQLEVKTSGSVTTRWEINGVKHSTTTSQVPGETLDEWARRHLAITKGLRDE